jgi:hypothetical protein
VITRFPHPYAPSLYFSGLLFLGVYLGDLLLVATYKGLRLDRGQNNLTIVKYQHRSGASTIGSINADALIFGLLNNAFNRSRIRCYYGGNPLIGDKVSQTDADEIHELPPTVECTDLIDIEHPSGLKNHPQVVFFLVEVKEVLLYMERFPLAFNTVLVGNNRAILSLVDLSADNEVPIPVEPGLQGNSMLEEYLGL